MPHRMVPATVDHLVYGSTSLQAGIDELERSLGVRAAGGGQHLGRGTHNALLGLAGPSYLEIIAPDPEQGRPPGPLPFCLENLHQRGLAGWATRTTEIDRLVAESRAAGYDPGPIESMERLRPDGTTIRWRLTSMPYSASTFVVPFVIDWGDSPHPSVSAPAGASLIALRIEHPDPPTIRHALDALHLEVVVSHGAEPALIALLDTPRGRVELR